MGRISRVVSVAGASVIVGLAPAVASPGAQSELGLQLSPGTPAARAALRLHIVYRDPAHPDGKPSPIRHIVIGLPHGMRLNVSSVPRCDASDQQLDLEGPGGCPAASEVGTGVLTADTGFGPPLDPFATKVTIFNDGQGWVEVVQDPHTGATVGLDRLHVSGDTLTGSPPATPGGPPDGQTAVRTIDFAFPASSGYVTAPPNCPTGAWTSTAAFTFADGTTQHVESSSACEAPSHASVAAPRAQRRSVRCAGGPSHRRRSAARHRAVGRNGRRACRKTTGRATSRR